MQPLNALVGKYLQCFMKYRLWRVSDIEVGGILIQTLADNIAPQKKIHPLNALAVSESRGAKKFSLKTYCGFFVLACWSEVAFSLRTEIFLKSFRRRPTFPKQSQYISAITRTIGAPYNIM